MKAIFAFAALFSVLALLTITAFLFANGLPFIISHSDTFWGSRWDTWDDPASYGILSLLVTTLCVTALSVVMGVTIGLFTAICLYKFCPKRFHFKYKGGNKFILKAVNAINKVNLSSVISQLTNLLAGVPSVIFGLIGMQLIVPFMRDYVSSTGFGFGILSASIVLAVMILPTIVSVSLDAMNAVSSTYYEGALALGATREQATFKVLIPAAKSGIFAGVVLAVGRALGETMAVCMVIGGNVEMPNSLFQSVSTLTSNIAANAMESTGETKTALVATGVVLFVFTFVLNFAFSLIKGDGEKIKKRKQRRAAKVKSEGEKADEKDKQSGV